MNSNTTDPIRIRAVPIQPVGERVRATEIRQGRTRSDGGAMFSGEGNVNRSRGAPMEVRLRVSAAHTQVDKLTELRKWAPDATPDGRGSFNYTDLTTGERTAFDEEGFLGIRDVAEGIPSIVEFIGGIGGGILGGGGAGALTVGTGTIPGAMAGAGAGATAMREAAERTMRGIFGVQDTRSVGQQVGNAATTFGVNALGEGTAQLAARGMRGAAGAALGSARITPNAEERAFTKAGDLIDVRVPKAMNTRSRSLQWLLGKMRVSPMTSQILANGALEMEEGTARAYARTLKQVSGGQEVGHDPFLRGIRNAAKGVQERFDQNREGLDAVMMQHFNRFLPGGRMEIPNTTALLADIESRVAAAPNSLREDYALALKQVKQLIADAAGEVTQTPSPILGANGMPAAVTETVVREPGIPVDVVRKIRSRIGKVTHFDSPLMLKPEGEIHLGELYQALRKDLHQAAVVADNAAGPGTNATQESLRLHDDYVHLSRDSETLANLETFAKLSDNMDDLRPFDWVMKVSRQDYGPERLAATLNNFTAEENEAIAGSVFKGMGTVLDAHGAEVFSPDLFFRNYREGARVLNPLFGRTQFRNVLASMQSVSTMSSKAAEARRFSLAKPGSIGFGGVATGTGAGYWTVTHAPEVVAVAALGGLSSLYAAKLLASPSWTRWLVSAAKAGTYGMAQATRLATIKRTEPALRDAITAYEANMKKAGANVPDSTFTQHLNRVGTNYEPR